MFGVVRKVVEPGRYRVALIQRRNTPGASTIDIYHHDELEPCRVLDPCPRCKGHGINIVLDLWTCSACKGTGERVRPILTSWQRLVEED